MRNAYVYIMASISRRLYTGVTSDLARRVSEHKLNEGSRHTRRYRQHKLVYYEWHGDMREAIAREKELKGWLRAKKVALIEEDNAQWRDLSMEFDDDEGQQVKGRCGRGRGRHDIAATVVAVANGATRSEESFGAQDTSTNKASRRIVL